MATKKTTAVAKKSDSVSLKGGIVKLTDAEMRERFAGGVGDGWSDFTEFTIMEPGDFVEGVFMGEGPGREIADKITGEVKPCKTWLVRVHEGLTLDILGNYNLDRELSALEGRCQVQIARLANKQDGAKQIADVKVRSRPM